MKSAVIFYHKNLTQIYKQRWIDLCVKSVQNQTYKNFNIFEVDYGNTNYKIPSLNSDYFYNKSFENHIYAMNFLINEIFSKDYDVVFNTNLDDFYNSNRFEFQINKIKEGYDLVSSDFCYLEETSESEDRIFRVKHIHRYDDIKYNLNNNHNVIAHPCVAITKDFWKDYKYNSSLIGWEDLELWKRAINGGKKFFIIDSVLLFYRVHKHQVTKNSSCPPCKVNSCLHDEVVNMKISQK